MSTPVRITRAGRLGRADLDAFGTKLTVLTARAGSAASAALAVRAGLTAVDMAGGAGRSRAADRMAARAAAAAGCAVLVSAGGDIATAGAPPPGGWRVQIAPDLMALGLSTGGIATVRSAEAGSPWRSVTVAATSCQEARRAAVAAASRPDAAAWLDSTGLTGRLVGTDGTVVLTGSWASELVAA